MSTDAKGPWQGWYRPRGKPEIDWKELPFTEAPTRTGCYEKVMEQGELVNHGEENWDYLILAKGQQP